MKTNEVKPVLIRLPGQLVKRLDAAAKRQQRSRSAEIRVRLTASLDSKKAEVVS